MRVMKTATKIYPKKEITENPVYPMLPQGQERLAALGISGTRPARQGPRRAGVLRRRLPRWARTRGALAALCAAASRAGRAGEEPRREAARGAAALGKGGEGRWTSSRRVAARGVLGRVVRVRYGMSWVGGVGLCGWLCWAVECRISRVMGWLAGWA